VVETEEARIKRVYARRKQLVREDRYSCFNPGNVLIEQEIDRHFLATLYRLGRVPLRGKQILEVGCGRGDWLRKLICWGAQPEDIFGIDLLEERINEARRLLPKSVTLMTENASKLEFSDQAFDLVLQFTLFSSVLDGALKGRIANEMLRVLRPDGCIIWYDFHINNPFNPDVRGVSKREIRQLFPDCDTYFRRVTLAPPIARVLGHVSPVLCRLISGVRIFSTHYLVFIWKVPHV
jgi:ubiquinone/menaquinone biosynthesis C-methylase UbiE